MNGTPSSADSDLKISDFPLAYHDRENRWMRPWRVIDSRSKFVKIDCDGHMIEMSIDRCKPYRIADKVRKLMNDGLNIGKTTPCENSLLISDDYRGYGGFWDFIDNLLKHNPYFHGENYSNV